MDAIEAIRREACDGLTAAELIARYPVSKRLFTLRFREATGHSVLYNELCVPKKITWNQGWTHGWSPAGMAAWTIDGGFDAATSRKGASAPTSYNAGTLAATE